MSFFERKFKLSKDDASDTKGALRKSEGRDFNSEILEAEEDLEDANNKLEKKKSSCESIKLKMAECGSQISEINEKIKSIPAEIIDVLKVQQDLLDKKNQLISVSDQNEEFQKNRDDDRTTYQRVVDFLGDFDVESLFNKQERANDLLDQIASLENLLSSEEEELVRNRNKEKLLSGIPCGHAYPKCKFIKDAYGIKSHDPPK